MKRMALAAALIVAAPVPVLAGPVYSSSEGHRYDYSLNDNGAVLMSVNPVTRFKGSGAGTEEVTGTETLYLGRDCDAFSPVLGHGRWSWANGGFVVELDGARIGFPRQEIEAGQGLNCAM